jgi:hypothetical protein
MAAKDEKAPAALQVIILDGNGKEWGRLYANAKQFQSGSVGFYGNGKLNNPDNLTARYQCGLTFTLIGSKEKV